MPYIFSFILGMIVILPSALADDHPLRDRPLSLEVLTFHNSISYNDMQAIHFESMGDDRFRPIARIPIRAEMKGDFSDNRKGRNEKGRIFDPLHFIALNGLLKTHQHGSIDDDTLITEFERRYPKPSQVQCVTLGTWVRLREWYALAARPEVAADGTKYPFFTYSRPAFDFKDKMNLASLIQLATKAHEDVLDAIELHVIRAGLAMIASQVPASFADAKLGKRFTRANAGWEDNEALNHGFKLDDHMIAWEISRAGQSEPGLFQKLLPIVTAIAAKEAQLYGVPLDRAFLMAHATDRAHARLFQETFGFELLTPSEQVQRGGHSMLRLSIAKALEMKFYRPRLVSSDVDELINLSGGRLNEVAAFNFFRIVKQYIRSYVDVEIRSSLQSQPMLVADRSVALYQGIETLIHSIGFDAAGAERVTKMISTFSSPSHDAVSLQDVYFMPEQLVGGDQHPLYYNLAVFNVPKLAVDDSEPYLRDLLIELYTWERGRVSFFPVEQFNSNFGLTIYTKNKDLKNLVISLGGSFMPVQFRPAQLDVFTMSGSFEGKPQDAFAITFGGWQLAHMRAQHAASMKNVVLKTNHFERQDSLCSTLF